MNYDEASIVLFFRVVAGFLVGLAAGGCFVVARSSGVLFTGAAIHDRRYKLKRCKNCLVLSGAQITISVQCGGLDRFFGGAGTEALQRALISSAARDQ